MITEYVNRLGQNLVRNSDAKVPFIIKVVDSDEINAFALPGGFMFVNTGLILKAGNEAELAGVLAHEIAHVAARHGTKQATRGELLNYASMSLIFFGGWAGYAVRQVAGLAIPMGFLEFSRAMESQADHLGLEYMYKTGYDPAALVDFFEKIESQEKKKPGTIARAFSTHPLTSSRIRAAQNEIQTRAGGAAANMCWIPPSSMTCANGWRDPEPAQGHYCDPDRPSGAAQTRPGQLIGPAN